MQNTEMNKNKRQWGREGVTEEKAADSEDYEEIPFIHVLFLSLCISFACLLSLKSKLYAFVHIIHPPFA